MPSNGPIHCMRRKTREVAIPGWPAAVAEQVVYECHRYLAVRPDRWVDNAHSMPAAGGNARCRGNREQTRHQRRPH